MGAQPVLRQFCSVLRIAVLYIGPVSVHEPISRCWQHSGFKDRDVERCSKILRKKKRGDLPDAEKAPKALTEWQHALWVSMVLGSSVQMTSLRRFGRITHKCLLISEHTASPITFLLLSREAQPPLLVAIPLQRHLRLDIGLDTFGVKRPAHGGLADESPASSA